MKKAVYSFIAVALICSAVISFNSCKKIRHGVVEFKRDYIDPNMPDFYFAAFANDVENLNKNNGGQNHDLPGQGEITSTYSTTFFYFADLNLRKLGYTEKNSIQEKEASTTFINKEGKNKPGKGGYWANLGSGSSGNNGGGNGGNGGNGGGGSCSYTTYTGSGCPSGYVQVSSSKCCPSSAPYYCSVTNVCYSTCEAAAAAGCTNNISFGSSGGGGGGGGSSQVIFYAGNLTQYQQPIFITLNGSVIFSSPGNAKKLYSVWEASVPSCSTDEGCDQYALCHLIKVDITQTNNTWVANETNSTRTWSGSFTKTAGCTLIEVK